ncbi:response regulator transcription factor [Aquibacillus albus]|uniref:CheY-like chemotaxis protein n=1 Tax=Aquibacillus albus TaxID=1168171 RepID=A0ABS2N4F1_9BACI|nr:response regulator transcription factor [Aquibacillus albus]MBM7572974.1 CheY-like chemotaxis protein [Aquibacillus albus]
MTEAHIDSSILQSFHHFLYYYQASNLPCGVIVARADLDKSWISKLKEHLEKEEPATAVQVNYDAKKGIIGLLLDGCNLGYTHFYALYVKEFLKEHDRLTGTMIVGSFPENSDDAEQMLFHMIKEIIDNKRDGKEIQVFKNPTLKKTETSSILIVDQDVHILQLLKKYLEHHTKYTVHTATDGKSGLDLYKKLLPDLVITEINLSAVDGYQFIKQIKNMDEQTRGHSEIIVLTNKHLEEDIKRTFEYGVAEYMTKPFSLIELQARIKRLVKVTE